jgi:hypothetical protein
MSWMIVIHNVTEVRRGFPDIFPETPPCALRLLRVNIPDMNLSRAKQQIARKRSRHLWRVVNEDVCSSSVAIGGEDAWALLPSLVPREEYIHRAPHGAIDSLRLNAINHA